MFSVKYDTATGIIRCVAGGFLTAADVQRFSVAVHESVQRCLRERGAVRMLVLSPETQVQTAETLEAAQRAKQKLGPDYRIATVVTSPLAKLQAARVLASDRDRAFTSEAEALAWLTASRQAAQPRSAAA